MVPASPRALGLRVCAQASSALILWAFSIAAAPLPVASGGGQSEPEPEVSWAAFVSPTTTSGVAADETTIEEANAEESELGAVAGAQGPERFGPGSCISLSRSAVGTCQFTTACGKENLSSVELAFVCFNPGTPVPHALHSFGQGSLKAEEAFDTEVPCIRCSTVTSAFSTGGPLIREALRNLADFGLDPSESFDCQAGYDNWVSGWSAEKKEWCCREKHMACFDCLADSIHWDAAWSDMKKDYCCKTFSFGCPPSSTTTPTSQPFDCSAGLPNSEAGWSDDKKLWCCQNEGRGCPPTTTSSTTPTSQPFDCSAGLPNSEAGWSDDKKLWCCQNEGRACPQTFNCTADVSHWEAAWSTQKKQWCCQNQGVACDKSSKGPAPPVASPPSAKPHYDCTVGDSDWESNWSGEKQQWCCDNEGKACEPFNCTNGYLGAQARWQPEKRQWCCKKKGLGCEDAGIADKPTSEPFSCQESAFNAASGWSAEKQKWCCRNKNAGCSAASSTLPPFDCDAAYANWEAAWSFDKKLWCCLNQIRGCTQGTIPFNCTAGADRWSSGWSPEKKNWCCKAQGVGCSKVPVRSDDSAGRGGQVREMSPAEAAFFGPSACVSTFRSPAGTCIVQTRCAGVDISGFNVGVTCVDETGGYQRYYFGAGALSAEETFDSRLSCSACVGVGNTTASTRQLQGVMSKQLIEDVTSLKEDVRGLKEQMLAIQRALSEQARSGEKGAKEEGNADDDGEGAANSDQEEDAEKNMTTTGGLSTTSEVAEENAEKNVTTTDEPSTTLEGVTTTGGPPMTTGPEEAGPAMTTSSLAPAPSYASAPSHKVDKLSPEEHKKRMAAKKEKAEQKGNASGEEEEGEKEKEEVEEEAKGNESNEAKDEKEEEEQAEGDKEKGEKEGKEEQENEEESKLFVESLRAPRSLVAALAAAPKGRSRPRPGDASRALKALGLAPTPAPTLQAAFDDSDLAFAGIGEANAATGPALKAADGPAVKVGAQRRATEKMSLRDLFAGLAHPAAGRQ